MNKSMEQAKDALKFWRAVEEATGERGSRPACLLYLAGVYPREVPFEELEKALDVGKSQVSRTVMAMHKFAPGGAEGYDLVEVSFDPRQPRIKLVRLNERGVKAASSILKLWNP